MAELQFNANNGGTMTLLSEDEVPLKIFTWLAIISPTQFHFKIETVEGVISYNPQWVMRQLGYDQ